MIWLSVNETADLLGVTPQAVTKYAYEGKFSTGIRHIKGKGRGGKVLQISITVLPEAAQHKYYLNHYKANNPTENVLDSGIKINQPLDNYTLSQKEKAEKKLTVIKEYRQFERKFTKENAKASKDQCKDAFVEEWNLKNEDFTISKPSLYRWLKKAKEDKTLGLVDKRGGYNKGESSIPKSAWDKFLEHYLTQSRLQIKTCYEIARLYANEEGIIIPDYKVFHYHANRIPYPILVYYREGPKAFEDKCSPNIERDYTKLHSNDIWVSDHHIWDEHVVVEEKGDLKLKLVRLWGSYWMDMRSRRIVAKHLRVGDPNADVVLASFAEGVRKHGIPKEVILDNGRDYKAKDLFSDGNKVSGFNGRALFEEDDKKQARVDSLALQMDITVHWAIPYNAKAKPIERTFGTFESQFGRLFNSYLGNNPTKRPERLKKLGLEEYPTLEEYKQLHDDYIEYVYNENPHSGDGMFGKSPREVHEENLYELRQVTDDVLRLWLMRTTKPYTVQRNGIKILGSWYYSTDMVPLQKKKVFARYGIEDINTVYIYDEQDVFLCMAYRKEKLQFGASKEDYQREQKLKKEALKTAKAGKPVTDKRTKNVDEIKAIVEMQKKENLSKKTTVEKPKTVDVLVRNETFEDAARKMKQSKNDLIKERGEHLRNQQKMAKEKSQELKETFEKVEKLWEQRIAEKSVNY
ncbi:MAG: Mu transposase C-terminal domain-containing protein [Clostridiaceae bacterium]|nr:Mu transposase C-terminal domain-containing protein [Clostridiaceae bacterium]